MVEVEWLDNLQNNNLLTEEEEARKSLQEFERIIKADLEHIKNFTVQNLDELIGMIFDNCQDITEIEYYINTLKTLIAKDSNTREKLKYQQTLTRDDIIANNIYPIYGVYTANAIISMISTSDPIRMLQEFLLLTAIQVFAFKVNLDYFTSERYKKKIAKRLQELNKERTVDNYNVRVLYKFREMCIDELKAQRDKLNEIMQKNKNNQEVYNRMAAFLKTMNIDFVVEDISAPTKKRTKK